MPVQINKKGKTTPFKWEEGNHGLDHKCGTCKTVLSSPRAKKSCIGVHEFPCWGFHNTLFFNGQAHTCEACHTMREQSHKRVREIVSLLKTIQDLESAARAQGKGLNRKPSSAVLLTPPSESDHPDALAHAHSFPSAGKTKRERKADKSTSRTTTVAILAPVDLDRAQALLAAAAASDETAEESPPPRSRLRIKPPASAPPPYRALDNLLVQLGRPSVATTGGAKLARSLRGAVGAHLAVLRNENEEVEVRRRGFEVYVTRRGWEGVVAMQAEFDSVTGEKKGGGGSVGAAGAGAGAVEGTGEKR